ncbi:MAG: MFS transporter [Burkholderiales bacterium]
MIPAITGAALIGGRCCVICGSSRYATLAASALAENMSRAILIPLIVACALFMENMDSTVLATALPAIAADMGENPLSLKLAITSYLISLAIFIPISGWVADRYGSRTVFIAAMLVFMVGSLSCANADTLTGFVIARFFQGMGGAMMVPVGRLIIMRSVPKAGVVKAMSYLTMPAMLGPIMGPPLGGLITEHFSWRGIFLINVPVSILGLILIFFFIPNLREENVPAMDGRGLFLSGLGLSMILLALSALGGHLLPDAVIAMCFLVGCLSLYAYWRHSLVAPHPVLRLDLLQLTSFRAGVVGGTLFRIGTGALPFLLPLMLQLGFGLSPSQSGLITCFTAVGALSMRTFTVFILRRIGFRRALTWNSVGSSLVLVGFGLFTAETSHTFIAAVLMITGCFRALQFTYTNTVAYADVNRETMGYATSFASMAHRISQSIGVAVGAYALELSSTLQGHTSIVTEDFLPAFAVATLISLSSVYFYRQLPPDAGAEMSGHRAKPMEKKINE